MQKAIQEVSEETLQIENYLKSLNPGDRVTFKGIEESTSVKMDLQGRNYLRSALRRLKLPYMSIRNVGIEVLSSHNASAIISDAVIKIDNSVKRAEKTTKHVRLRVYEELPANERKTIDVLGALFGSIRAFSNSAKQLFSKPIAKVGELIQDQK